MRNIGNLLKTKEAGKTLKTYIDQELKKRPYFSLDVLRDRVASMHNYLSLRDNSEVVTDELNKEFFGVWDSFFADHERTIGYLHPSQIQGACERKQVYELLGSEQNEVHGRISAQLQRIFDQGSFFHLYFQNLLWKAGVLIVSEATVKNKRKRLHGSTDGIVKINGHYYLLEIKTITTFQIGSVKQKPKREHVYQATIYADELKDKYDLVGIIFLYINKDSADVIEHPVPLKKKIVDLKNWKIDKLLEHAETKVLPERICAKVKDGAGCPYQSVCFNLKHE